MPQELSHEEILNNTLAEIHNRLAEISTYLKTGLAIFAKLDHYDTNLLENDMAANISLDTLEDYRDKHGFKKSRHVIGFSKNKGLYSFGKNTLDKLPLGDFARTAPIDEDTGAFLEQE